MKSFESNIISIYGEAGKEWLSDLPTLISHIQSKYKLSDLQPLNNLSYNYVMKATWCNQLVIIKLSIDSLIQEITTLNSLQNYGTVKVLFYEKKLLALEMLSGPTLRFYFPDREDESIEMAANLMHRIHTAPLPLKHNLPYIRSWLKALDKDVQIPTHYLQKARYLRDKLLHEAQNDVLLHGDLHHDNILKNHDEWLAIDPKGVIGERAYEVGAFIRNPIPKLLNDNPSSIIKYRINTFALLLKISPDKIKDWCFVQAVLALVWAIDDDYNIDTFKQLVEIFDST